MSSLPSLAARPAIRRRPAPPPTKDLQLDPAERDAAAKAKAGSARLRLALLRYGAKHGLPNLSPQACLAALEWLEAGRRVRRKAAAPKRARPGPASTEAEQGPRRKRGRPKGSTNKKKEGAADGARR